MRAKNFNYENNVFINCPFDDEYKPMFRAMVFTIHDAGFVARCALEEEDASQYRLTKILKIISECKYSVHALSRIELSANSQLPRFNMPFELGLYLGCREFGKVYHKDKSCLILDQEQYRYQKFISDISGQDIASHKGNIEQLIEKTRNYLRSQSKRENIPGGEIIYKRYVQFEDDFPAITAELNLDKPERLPFIDFSHVVTTWLKTHLSTAL